MGVFSEARWKGRRPARRWGLVDTVGFDTDSFGAPARNVLQRFFSVVKHTPATADGLILGR